MHRLVRSCAVFGFALLLLWPTDGGSAEEAASRPTGPVPSRSEDNSGGRNETSPRVGPVAEAGAVAAIGPPSQAAAEAPSASQDRPVAPPDAPAPAPAASPRPVTKAQKAPPNAAALQRVRPKPTVTFEAARRAAFRSDQGS